MLKNKKSTQSGFGLVELMVSISLVVLVTSVILARHDSYNGAVLLRSQAYDVALKLREVQMEAVSVVAQEGDYRAPLGACFSTQWPNRYYVFIDTNGNGACDLATEQVGQQGNIDPRFQINSLGLVTTLSESTPANNVSILFERPNFDAKFFVNGTPQNNVEAVEIGIFRVGASQQSTNVSDLRVMEVSRTGQILVRTAKNNSVSVICDPTNSNKNCDDNSGGDPVDTLPNDEGAKVDESNTDPKEDVGGDTGTELPPENPEEPKV